MADYRKLIPFILKFEGGYVNDPADSGGPTNKGVTINTFRSVYGRAKTINDLKHMTDNEWRHIFKSLYWDRCKADDITDQSIANLLVDWAYNSGTSLAIRHIQRIVGVNADGIMGNITLSAINRRSPLPLFGALKQDRIAFLNTTAQKNPRKKKFLKGWLNRVNSFTYGQIYF